MSQNQLMSDLIAAFSNLYPQRIFTRSRQEFGEYTAEERQQGIVTITVNDVEGDAVTSKLNLTVIAHIELPTTITHNSITDAVLAGESLPEAIEDAESKLAGELRFAAEYASPQLVFKRITHSEQLGMQSSNWGWIACEACLGPIDTGCLHTEPETDLFNCQPLQLFEFSLDNEAMGLTVAAGKVEFSNEP